MQLSTSNGLPVNHLAQHGGGDREGGREGGERGEKEGKERGERKGEGVRGEKGMMEDRVELVSK